MMTDVCATAVLASVFKDLACFCGVGVIVIIVLKMLLVIATHYVGSWLCTFVSFLVFNLPQVGFRITSRPRR